MCHVFRSGPQWCFHNVWIIKHRKRWKYKNQFWKSRSYDHRSQTHHLCTWMSINPHDHLDFCMHHSKNKLKKNLQYLLNLVILNPCEVFITNKTQKVIENVELLYFCIFLKQDCLLKTSYLYCVNWCFSCYYIFHLVI